MRIEMIGHAGLLCEVDDLHVLMDPWIVGPANFDSWWHLPDIVCDLTGLPELDFLYISHLHGDHFHEPTLVRLLEAGQHPTVLIPKLYHDRFLQRLRRLGFRSILELPHGKEVAISRSVHVCCTQIGNDSMLAISDGSTTMLNANDALQGSHPGIGLPILKALGERYRFDIAFLAFGTAGPFPKCYHIEDAPLNGFDPWVKERAMLNNFVEATRAAAPRVVVPFAGAFALLADRLAWMNDAKTTPVDALGALQQKSPEIQGLEMNPGDIWDSRGGLIQRHAPMDWSRRLEVIRTMRASRATELARIEARERQGPADLPALFRRRLTQNLRRFPFLRRRLDCSILFHVEGEPGGQWEVDLRRPTGWFREGDSGSWALKLHIPARLLGEVLTDPDGWETLGISYKLDLHMKAGSRAKEGLLDRLIFTPSPLWLMKTMLAPRFAEFAIRRKEEFLEGLRGKLAGTG